MHSLAHGRPGDHRLSRGSRNSAAVAKCRSGPGNNARDFAVPDLQPSPTKPSSPSSRDKRFRKGYGDGGGGGGNCNDDDRESVGSSPTPPREPALRSPYQSQQRSPRRSPRRSLPGDTRCKHDSNHDEMDAPPIHLPQRSPRGRSSPQSTHVPAMDLLNNYTTPTNGDGCRVTASTSGRSSPSRRKSPRNHMKSPTADREIHENDHENNHENNCSSSSKPQKAEFDEGDGGGCGVDSSNRWDPKGGALDVPYPAKWRCFGRRPPALLEYRPMGEMRTRNVRPAGKQSYLMRRADERRGCDNQIYEGDLWDDNYGLAKPVTERRTRPLEYGATRVIRTGDVDPWFQPSRGDLIVINPAQNYYRAMKSGYVMSLRGRYMFGIGDLVLRLGKFLPTGQYVPYGNLELYIYTSSRDWRFLGRQPYLLVDFNYHNLDYESPGKYLAIGTFLTESFKPRRGDIIIRGGAWAENHPNKHRRHHTSVKYWKPNTDFLPNDMLLRPYVDIGRCERTREFYWGAAELYSYSGKGLAWAYWGRDHHVCDTPFPGGENEIIKTGHYKDETGYYGSDNFEGVS